MSRQRPLLTATLSYFSLLALVCPRVDGQVLYGSITGNVTDASQAAIANAKVEVLEVNTGATKTTTTNNDGLYVVTELQQGTYRVTVSNPSFSNATVEGIQVAANQTRRVDAVLQVGSVNQSVVVSGTTETLQTDRADVSTNITTRQLTNLPLTGSTGRNFQSLITLVPGTSMQGEQNSAAANPQRAISFNVNGVSRLQNNTTIDGSSVTYPWLPTNIAYVPPAEAIDTVNVVTNAFNAEQGLAGGAIVNVSIKSGTNDFHGTGWIFNTDSHFKARNYFQTTPQNPKDILNQFGFTFGGPVWIPKVYDGKNKLFFFVDWERTTRRQSSPIRFYSLPTDPLRNGDFSGPVANGTTIYDPASNADPTRRTPFSGNRIPANRIDPGSLALIRLIPEPNVGGLVGANQFVNNYFANGVGRTDRDAIDIKINHHPTEKLSYFGRYSTAPSTIFDPPALGGAGGDPLNGGQPGNAIGRVQVAGAGVTYLFGPSLYVDANAGYTRQRLGAENVDIDQNFGLDVMGIPGTNGSDRLLGGIPFFAVSNWANLGNSSTGSPFLFRDNQYVATTNLSWIKSTHTLRFGWAYQNQQLNHFQAQGGTFQTVRGSFQFNGQGTALQNGPTANRFNSWADFLLGNSSAAGKSAQRVNPNTLRLHTYAVYAQDQWQVSPKLTFNYGLRWELYPFPRTDHGGVARFDPATGNVYVGGVGTVPDDTFASNGSGLFLPRAGLAYRVTERTVIRSGFGLSADPRPFIDFRNAYPNINNWQMPQINNNPFISVTNFRQGLNEAAFGQFPNLGSGVIKLPANSGTTTFPGDQQRKYIESFNLILQHQIDSKTTASAGYVGTRSVGQMGFININAAPPGGGNAGRALAQRLGLLADINDIIPFKTATYDSLQSQLTRRFGDSVVGAVYTWSKAINWQDNDQNPPFQWPGAWNQNRGPAGYDRTHNFQGYFTAQSPFGRNHRWLQHGIGNLLLGGWDLNGIIAAESGLPIFVTQNSPGNLNASGSTQVPDLVKSSIETIGGIGLGHSYFDTTGFRQVNIPSGQPQRFGNSGRNNIRGPGLFTFDAGLARTFPLGERLHLQFRVDGLNILNHANFSNPAGNVSDPNSFGYITTTATTERQFRFAARVFF